MVTTAPSPMPSYAALPNPSLITVALTNSAVLLLVGQTVGSRAINIYKLKFALSEQSLAHIWASLEAVAKVPMVNLLRNFMCTKHQKEVRNT